MDTESIREVETGEYQQSPIYRVCRHHHQHTQSLFSFELWQEAAKANFKILQENNMSLHKILTENAFSALSYRSEFKSVAVLEPLFQFHPGWPAMKTRLEKDRHIQ